MTTDPENTRIHGGLSLHPEHAASDSNSSHSSDTRDAFGNQIIHGDCLQVLRKLPDACVDFVLTDPPYLVNYRDRLGRSIPNDDNSRWLFPSFSEISRVLKPDSYCVSFYGWSKAERFLSAWKECGLRPVGHFVWIKRYSSRIRHAEARHEQAYLLAKGNPVPPNAPPPDVLAWDYSGNTLHPTQKPVRGLVRLITAYSPRGGVVLDPFAGSGSTGVAARKLGRRFILIETDPRYYAAAARRLT